MHNSIVMGRRRDSLKAVELWAANEDPENVKSITDNLLVFLSVAMAMYTNPATLDVYLTSCRRIIYKASNGKINLRKNEYGRLFTLPRAMKDKLTAKAKDRLNKSHTRMMTFSKIDIVGCLLDLCKAFDTHKSIHTAILIVQMCTGARWIEVLGMSRFYRATHLPNHFRVVGVAKCVKNKKELYCDKHCTCVLFKPCLFKSVEYILSLLDYIYDTFYAENGAFVEDVDNRTIHNRYYQKTNQMFNTLMCGKFQRHASKTHLLRRLYAHVAYIGYGEKQETLSHYIMKTLGHDHLSTGLAYNEINVSGMSRDDARRVCYYAVKWFADQ